MAVEHNTLPSEAQHIIHRWKVADETALNAIVPTLGDVDKIALRVDNDTFYRLKAHDPVIWVKVGSSETVDLSNYYTKSETDALIPTIPDFKTINGETITGSGDIVIEGGATDLTNYYTKTEVDTLISNIDYSSYYTKTEVDTLIANLPQTDLSGYYTKSEVDTLIAGIETGTVDLSNYYTKSETYNKTEIDTAIASVTPAELTNNLSHITQIRMTQKEGSIYKYTTPLTTWFTLPFNYASIDDLLQFDSATHTITAKKTGYYIINMSVVHSQTTTDGASAWTRYALVDGSFDTSLTIPTYANSHYYSQTYSSDPVGLQETISLYLTIGQSIKIVMYTGHSTAFIGTIFETDTFYSTYINMYMLSGVGVVNEGLNAYELAVQEGFVGTLTDWLNSLKGDTGATGATGADGADGVGVPTGGTTGQILAKVDNTDYNTEWVDAPTGGGSAEYPDMTGNAGKVLGTDGTNVSWVDNGDAVALNMRYAHVVCDITSSPGAIGTPTNWLTTWYDNSTMDIIQKVSNSRLLLKAGRTYRIAGGVTGFNGSTTAELSTKIYAAKVSDSVFTEVQGGFSYQLPVNSTGSYVRSAFTNCYIKAEEDMWVECRVNYFAGTISYYSSRYTITEYLNVTGEGAITLPPVTNQSGKFLSNNGTDIEWVKPEFNGLSELPQYQLNTEVLTSERWTNGKPIYKKTIDFGALPNNTTKSVAHGVSDMETIWINQDKSRVVVNGTSYSVNFPNGTTTSMWSSSVDNTNFYIQTWTNRTTLNGIVTIEYTKTTDTASSPVALVGSSYNISSAEYVLPFTRNGKTVYGIEIDCGNMPNNTTKNVAIPNYNNAYDYDIVKFKASDSTYHINVPIQWSSTTYIERWITRASGSLTIVSNFNASSLTGKAVLEYTKD